MTVSENPEIAAPDADWERHWNTICLGIVTIATAAIGAAFFASDLGTDITSWLKLFLALIAIVAYAWVVVLAGHTILAAPASPEGSGTSRRRRTQYVFLCFLLELFALLELLLIRVWTDYLSALTATQ